MWWWKPQTRAFFGRLWAKPLMFAAALAFASPCLCAAALAQASPTEPLLSKGGQAVAAEGVIADRADAALAEDLANVMLSRRLRVLPIIGHGPVQNAADLMHVKGVDFAILPSDLFA